MATKFTQSVKFESSIEQFYYDGARQMMKDNGMKSMNEFFKSEFPNISVESLKISKDRFKQILQVAHKDYLTICFDPLNLKNGF